MSEEYKGWASSLGNRSNTGLEGQSNTGARWESVGSEQYGLSTIFGLIGKFRKSEQCMGLVGILIIQGSVGQTRATAFRVGGLSREHVLRDETATINHTTHKRHSKGCLFNMPCQHSISDNFV